MKNQKKPRIGRKPYYEAVKLAKDLVLKRRLSYRDAALIIAKKLGKQKVDTKSVYRWVRQEV